jgi:adenylate kinase
LTGEGIQLDRVVNFHVSREAIVRRLSGRRSCPKCQATFHVEFAPSQKGALCDRCGDTLIQRNDDKPEAIETRLKVYEEQTAPLISFYEKQNLLSRLDGSNPVDRVYQDLTTLLATHKMA